MIKFLTLDTTIERFGKTKKTGVSRFRNIMFEILISSNSFSISFWKLSFTISKFSLRLPDSSNSFVCSKIRFSTNLSAAILLIFDKNSLKITHLFAVKKKSFRFSNRIFKVLRIKIYDESDQQGANQKVILSNFPHSNFPSTF